MTSWGSPSAPRPGRRRRRRRAGSAPAARPATASTARQVARRPRHPVLLPEPRAGVRRARSSRTSRASTRRAGRRSPASSCNREIKFGSLLDRARAWDAEAVATGHYARVGAGSGDRARAPPDRAGRGEGSDLLPLAAHAGAARPRRAFPIGGLSKDEVRARGPGARARGGRRTPRARRSASSRRRLPGVPPRAGAGGVPAGPDRGRGRPGARARTPGSAPTRSASAAGSAGSGRRRSTWSGLDPARNAVVVGPREALRATGSSPSGSTGSRSAPLAAPLAVEARVRHRAPRVPAHVVPRRRPARSRCVSRRPSARSRPASRSSSTGAKWSSAAASSRRRLTRFRGAWYPLGGCLSLFSQHPRREADMTGNRLVVICAPA